MEESESFLLQPAIKSITENSYIPSLQKWKKEDRLSKLDIFESPTSTRQNQPKRNIIQATYVILNFVVVTLTKKCKVTGTIINSNTYYLTQCIQNTTILTYDQYKNINDIYYIQFFNRME